LNEIVHIPFHGGEVLAIEQDGKPFIVLKPAFEHIGLDADRQIKKVQQHAWACTSVTAVQVGDQRRNMITADMRTFLMALATIPIKRVREEVRDTLAAYQSKVADVIEAYFTRARRPEPVAELPAATPFEPVTYSLADTVVLMRQKFGVKVPVVELTRVLRQGGVLCQNGKPKTDYEAIFWHTGTAYEVFGHRIEALYRLYESTKLRLEMAAQARLRMDPPGWPELPFDGSSS
jgi:hypothetical protein